MPMWQDGSRLFCSTVIDWPHAPDCKFKISLSTC